MAGKTKIKLKSQREKDLEDKLYEIATLGHGIPEGSRDYANIGKMAVERAQRAIAGVCKTCGARKQFISKGQR